MRILVATHNYPRFAGDPAGAFVARLARGMVRRGDSVRVIAPHTPGTPVVATEDGVHVHRFRYAPERWERVGYRGDLHRTRVLSAKALLGVPALLASFRWQLRRAVATFAPDVIHAHWWIPAGLLSTGLGVPVVITAHGSDVRMLDRSAIARRLARFTLTRAAAVTTVSAFLASDLATAIPAAASRIQPLYLPLDLDHFATGAGAEKAQPPRVLYAGNLVGSKGVQDLIEAVGILSARGIPVQLRILGEGPMRPALERLAADRGLSAIVTFHDFRPQHEMPAEYGASTITVLPTRGREEGLGLTLAEALVAGSAVVGTRAGGIPEVVRDGETGLLANAGSPSDLAEKIARLLADGDLRTRLTMSGRARVHAMFDQEQAVARFQQLLHDVASAHRRG
jgi:glycosyltransferase involved in cell wall biosynthesis